MTTWLNAKRVNRRAKKKNKNQRSKAKKVHTNPNRS